MMLLKRCQFLTFLFLSFSFFNSRAQQTVHKFITERTGMDYNYGLVTDGNYLYGTRYDGFNDGNGAVFRMKKDGSSYEVISEFDGSNGANPIGQMVLLGSTLYGMTLFGGVNDIGVVYKVHTDGTGFTKLLDFNGENGALPYASLFISNNVLYGISGQGGAYAQGLIFKINLDGSDFQDLHSFNYDGDYPTGSVVIQDNKLWGVTIRGGANNAGTIFSYDLATSQFQTHYHFLSDEGYPLNGPILSGSVLYGTTMRGGSGGLIYKFDINTNVFSVVSTSITSPARLTLWGNMFYGVELGGAGKLFMIGINGNDYLEPHMFNGSDGRDPIGGLTLIDDALYGHVNGGDHNYGVVFKFSPSNFEFTELIDFTATNTGYEPNGALAFSTGSAFGITTGGGEFNQGTIYKINKDGSDHTIIHNFQDRANPEYGVILSGSKLYGMTLMGGTNEMGVIFEIDTTGANYNVPFNFAPAEGGFPTGSLIDQGDFFYGMTGMGTAYKGVIFRYHKTTGEYERIFEFQDTDAQLPRGSYAMAHGRLYGLALGGVADGVLFSINTDGSDFQKIVDVDAATAGRYGNSVTIVDSTIYVSMRQGGSQDVGVLYKVDLDGTNFQQLRDFSYSEGAIPDGELVVVGDQIFGMVELGGPSLSGGIYKIKTDGTGFEWLTGSEEGRTGRRASSGGAGFTTLGSLSLNNDYMYGAVSISSSDKTFGSIVRYALDGSDVEVPTGIEREQVSYDIYPNPTDSYLFIKSSRPIRDVVVINASGQRMVVQSGSNVVDIRNLPAGLYSIIIDRKAHRFIKR